MKRQNYSAAPASVRVRQCRQRTKEFVSALLGREIGYNEAMKVKRDLAAAEIIPRTNMTRPGEPLRGPSLRSKAREAGIAISHVAVWKRIKRGWSEELALSMPVGFVGPGGMKRNHPDSLAVKARSAGLPPDMVRRRVREGMSEEQALLTPPVQHNRRYRSGPTN